MTYRVEKRVGEGDWEASIEKFDTFYEAYHYLNQNRYYYTNPRIYNVETGEVVWSMLGISDGKKEEKGTDGLPSVEVQEKQLAVAETHAVAMQSIAKSLSTLTEFIQGVTLPQVVNTLVKGNSVGGMLQGLITHSGRQGLDARTINQNALEMAKAAETAFKKYAEDLQNGRVNEQVLDGEKLTGYGQEEEK